MDGLDSLSEAALCRYNLKLLDTDLNVAGERTIGNVKAKVQDKEGTALQGVSSAGKQLSVVSAGVKPTVAKAPGVCRCCGEPHGLGPKGKEGCPECSRFACTKR